MGTADLSFKYGQRRAKADKAVAAEKAKKDAEEKAKRQGRKPAGRKSPVRTVTSEDAEPERDVKKLGNSIPSGKPEVTVSEETYRKSLERKNLEDLRATMMKRLVAVDADTRAELLNRKNLRAAGGKGMKSAKESEDPVVMSDADFEARAAEILGLRRKEDPARKEMSWMPADTSKKVGGYRREDFFGNWNSARSDRFQGGYRDPAFRENFIEGRMNGLKPGDAGYDRAYSAAKSAWSQAERQYDTRFREYGDSLLKAQRRKSIENGGPVSLVVPGDDKSPEVLSNGVRLDDLVRSVEEASASGARGVSVKVGNTTVSASKARPRRTGPYVGNGTYEFFQPGFRKELA